MEYGYLKRFLDALISFTALLLLSPLLITMILLLAVFQNGAVFFKQERPGKNGRIFGVIKFKTMKDTRDSSGNLLPDSERITGIGRFIRSTSIDELPQLINVLKGEMSLVGPRPLLVKYLPLYNEQQARRHEVRPGITGWAQVNGRNAISWEQKFEYDVWYVDNMSFSLDIKIIILTIKKVVVREGISSETAVTMEAFKGTK
ncbi:MAG: sugar transferase [Flavobacterium sp.]|nr:sugar transferase [Flavobacterium sp.]